MQVEGIYVPIITPFKDDLSIDYDAYGEVIDWQIENGTHGIIAVVQHRQRVWRQIIHQDAVFP